MAAYRFCLRRAGVGPEGIDRLGYYESPAAKLSRQLWSGRVAAGGMGGAGEAELGWLDAGCPERLIRERLGFEGPIDVFPHHLSHAASAYFYSGFGDAAILTVDGVGEWATTTFGRGRGGAIELLAEVDFPHSLGLFYSAITSFLGFAVNDGEGKVMGLAPYGEPRFVDRLLGLVERCGGPGGCDFRLAMECFDFVRGERMFTPALGELLGGPPRTPGSELLPFHRDVARSLQEALEVVLLDLVRALAERVDSPNLCLAGGVALNCMANGRLLRDGPFSRLFVQPAAGDAGGCLGAAALAHRRGLGASAAPAPRRLPDVYLGPRWTAGEVAALLTAAGLPALDFRGREGALLDATVDRLARGRVVGWFQGAMEFGPRSLGARSLLADPRDPAVRDRLNRSIKGREAFRPFAPSVLAERAGEHFDLGHPSPFMLETCRVASPLALPAITHVDGSSRPQTVDRAANPRFAALLERFAAATGCPLLLNTSFNVAGEPIVGSPVDALLTMARSGLDTLVVEDFVLDREALPAGWPELLAAWRPRGRSGFAAARGPLGADLYTFT